jgi:hypothetical protein
MAGRGSAYLFDCPGCNSSITSWTVRGTEIHQSRSETKRSTPLEQSHFVKAPDKDADPIRYYQQFEKSEKFARIAMASYNKKEDSVNILSTDVVTDNCNEWSEKQLEVVETIGMSLHGLLVKGDKEGEKCRFDPVAYPTSEALTDLSMADRSALRRFVHALATGDRLSNVSLINVNWEKYVKTTFAAKEIIRYLQSSMPGALKDIMGAQLMAQDVPNAVFNILNDFGITPGKGAGLSSDKGLAYFKLEQGLEDFCNDRYALVITYYDNMGFKQRAKRIGYKQYTKQIHVVITREELIELGIYKDPTKPPEEQTELSRERKKWLVERQSHGFDDVCAPRTDENGYDDYNCLAKSVLSSIDSLLSLVQNEKLPNLEECKELLKYANVEWPHAVPDTYGARREAQDDINYSPCDGEGDDDCGDVEDENVVDDEAGDQKPAARKQTSLGVNNARVDVPMERDLNEKKTCIVMADYSIEFRKMLLEIGVKDGDPLKDAIPIMETHGITLAGDGLPSHMFTRIKREQPGLYMDILNVYFGGFHTGLTGWKANGKLFAEAFLNDIFRMWRSSDKQLKWVMEPGDPNQIEDEMVMFIVGQYAAAIEGQIDASKALGLVTVDSSVCDIVDHMISRAKEHKIAMVALIQLRLAECLFLLLDSESNRDGAMYRTALKFLAIFFCSAHSPKYVSLGSDFFVDWHCSSEADKALFESILFRKTVNGRSIFGDRFVEWTIRDLRMFLGDHAIGDHHNSLVYRISLLLNDKKILRNVTKSQASDKSLQQSHLRINKVYCETFIYFVESKIWSVGTPVQVPSKPWQSRKDMDSSEWEENTGTSPSGGAHLNPELCFIFSEGLKRWKAYFTRFLVNGDLNDPARSESDQGVSLKLVEPTSAERQNREVLHLDRLVSTDFAFLMKRGVYTVEELKQELNELNNALPAGERLRQSHFKPREEGFKKSHLMLAVIEARKRVMAKVSNWARDRRQHKQDEFEQVHASETAAFQTRVNEELSSKFFGFNECAARNHYTTKYRVYGAREAVSSPTAAETQRGRWFQSPAAGSESTAGYGTSALAGMGNITPGGM